MGICKGIAGNRGRNPKGIFIHNDAGSQNANAAFYKDYLQRANLENGFAHYYVCSDGILPAEDDGNCAWHCGQTDGNTNYLAIEVCQSMGDINIFKANEEKALALAAQKCKQYGITPNADTIKLHQEVYATACPHRSVEIHGGKDATKAYFIKRITELMNSSNKNKSNECVLINSWQDNARVYFEDAGNGYIHMRNKKNGLYLDVANGDGSNGTLLQWYEKNETDAQKFKIVRKSHGEADYILFEPKVAPGKYLSVENNGKEGSGKDHLKVWEDLHNNQQKFWMKQAEDGAYLIYHVYSLFCIGVK